MTEYEFTLYFSGLTEMTEDNAEALYESGCDDCTPCHGLGRAYAHFAREALTLEAAIASAVRDVQNAGLAVDHIEIDGERVKSLKVS